MKLDKEALCMYFTAWAWVVNAGDDEDPTIRLYRGPLSRPGQAKRGPLSLHEGPLSWEALSAFTKACFPGRPPQPSHRSTGHGRRTAEGEPWERTAGAFT